jgi:hypothetical protein
MHRFDTANVHAFVEYHAARIEIAAGDAAAGRSHAELAVSLARRAEFPLRLVQALSVLGQATVRTDPATAREALDEISAIENSPGFPARLGAYNTIIVTVRVSQAEQHWRSALWTLRDAVRQRDHGVLTRMTAVALLAELLADLDRYRPAAVLVGVLMHGPYAPILRLVTTPADRQELDQKLTQVRAQLGDDAYELALAHGAGMALDEVIDTTLTAIDDALGGLPSDAD